GYLDLEPLVLEIALALGHGERQVVEEVLAADRDDDVVLLGGLGERAGGERGRHEHGETCDELLHCSSLVVLRFAGIRAVRAARASARLSSPARAHRGR